MIMAHAGMINNIITTWRKVSVDVEVKEKLCSFHVIDCLGNPLTDTVYLILK